MKAQFIKALIKTLVGDKNFLLLKDRDGNLKINPEHNILAKDHFGSNVIVELLDGDKFSGAEIADWLQHKKKLLTENRPKNGFFFYEVFIFEDAPGPDKLAAVTAEEFQNLPGRTFLKCLTVNLAANSVERHFKVPRTDLGLSKIITRLFAKGITNNTITDSELEELTLQKEAEYKITFQSKTPVITYALIGINVFIGLLLFLFSKQTGLSYSQLLVEFGAKENYRILSGEYWRFFTPIFLHANILHLFINCYSLYAVGDLVEKIFGRYKFAFVYFVAGITGNILSFIFSANPGVGASGAIFGLLGALLYFGINKPALFKSHLGHNVIFTILINLGYGFTNAGIDNFAHIGGLIGGFLASGIILKPERKNWYTNRRFYYALTVMLVVSGLVYGFNSTQSKIVVKINELEKLDEKEDWVRVQSKAKEILELKPREKKLKAYTLWTLAKAQALSGNYREAIASAKALTAIDPPNGHYLLGLFYFDTKQYALSRQELEQAKKTGAKYETIDPLLRDLDKLGK